MIKVMDPVQTAKNHGGVMEDAKNNRVVEFDPHTFVKDMYKAVVAGEYEFEDAATPISQLLCYVKVQRLHTNHSTK